MSHEHEITDAGSPQAPRVLVGSGDLFGALDAMRKERDWWRAKHWNAHHHAHQMFLDAGRLRTALEEIMRNTSSPSSVFTIAQRALRGDSPNTKDEPRAQDR